MQACRICELHSPAQPSTRSANSFWLAMLLCILFGTAIGRGPYAQDLVPAVEGGASSGCRQLHRPETKRGCQPDLPRARGPGRRSWLASRRFECHHRAWCRLWRSTQVHLQSCMNASKAEVVEGLRLSAGVRQTRRLTQVSSVMKSPSGMAAAVRHRLAWTSSGCHLGELQPWKRQSYTDQLPQSILSQAP